MADAYDSDSYVSTDCLRIFEKGLYYMKKYQMQTAVEPEIIPRYFSEIEDALYRLDFKDNFFVILSTEPEEYIQCATLETHTFQVEVRTKISDKIHHYRKCVTEQSELVNFFYKYYYGSLSLNGWADVSEEMVFI